MKKCFLLLIVLCSAQVLALGLSTPQEHEILFEQNKDVSLKYSIVNSESSPLSVVLQIDDGSLELPLPDNGKTFTVPPGKKLDYTLTFVLPSELKPGVYPLRVKFSAREDVQGMGGTLAVGDTIFIIEQFETGWPHGTLSLRRRYIQGQNVEFGVSIWNIGKTPIQKLSAKIELIDNNGIIKMFESEPVFLGALAKTVIPFVIQTEDLKQGHYMVQATLIADKVENILLASFNFGDPKITIPTPTLEAGQQNEITLRPLMEWNENIKDATIRMAVQNGLFDAGTKTTLSIGENALVFEGDVPNSRGGTYKAQLFIDNPDYHIVKDFEIEVKGTGLLGRIGSSGEQEIETEEFEQPKAGKAAAQQSTTKSEINLLIIVLLLIGWSAFSFMLGKYSEHMKSDRK